MNHPFNTLFPLLAETLGKANFIPTIDQELEAFLQPSLPVDIHEDDTHHYFVFEVPGVPKDKIQVEVLDGVLEVKAERQRGNETKTLSKKVKLPSDLRTENVKAKLQDGLLTLSFEKQPKPEATTIEIE